MKNLVSIFESNVSEISILVKLDPKAADLLSEIKDLDNELKTLENQFNLDAE